MSLSTVDVWIADWADPCRISDATWRVTVTDCGNQVIQWCNTAYEDIEAECGHAELQLPPGCYVVFALRRIPIHPPPNPAPFPPFFTILTNRQVLTLGCDMHGCVNLQAQSYIQTWDDLLLTTRLLQRQEVLPPNVADQVAQAMDAALAYVPRTDADAILRDLRQRLLYSSAPPSSTSAD